MSIILGFDLSTKYIGVAHCATLTPDSEFRIDSLEIKLGGDSFEERLKDAIVCLSIEIRGRTNLDHIAVEAPFAGPNGKTSMQLGKLCGALHSLAYQLTGKHPIEVTTTEVKKAMTSSGTASKKLMMQMARARFGLDQVGEHEADALGVCLAAAGKLRRMELEARGC